MSIRILIPALLIAGVAYGMFSPSQEFKPVVVAAHLPAHLPYDSVYMIVTNRSVYLRNGVEELGNTVDSTGTLRYAVAIERAEKFDLIFVKDLDELLSLFPKAPLTVYVHGDGKTLDKTLWRTSKMKALYGTNILIFSWPTRNPDLNGLDNFRNSIGNAKYSKKQFARFLHEYKDLRESGRDSNITYSAIIFHSLGNYLLENTVRAGLLNDLDPREFNVAVLNAAATESKPHAEWVSQLHMQKKLYVVSSKNDVNLMGAQYFTELPMLLGREVTGERAPNATYVDMTDALGFTFKRSKSHSYFVGEGPAENPNIAAFYRSVFTGNEKEMNALVKHDDKTNRLIVMAP